MKNKLLKFNQLYNSIINEEQLTNQPQQLLVNDQYEVDINGYNVNIIKFNNGKWQYQLNKEYFVDTIFDDPNDPWFPPIDQLSKVTEDSVFFDSEQLCKDAAAADISNMQIWGQIQKKD